MECFSGTHALISVIAVIAIVVFVILLPLKIYTNLNKGDLRSSKTLKWLSVKRETPKMMEVSQKDKYCLGLIPESTKEEDDEDGEKEEDDGKEEKGNSESSTQIQHPIEFKNADLPHACVPEINTLHTDASTQIESYSEIGGSVKRVISKSNQIPVNTQIFSSKKTIMPQQRLDTVNQTLDGLKHETVFSSNHPVEEQNNFPLDYTSEHANQAPKKEKGSLKNFELTGVLNPAHQPEINNSTISIRAPNPATNSSSPNRKFRLGSQKVFPVSPKSGTRSLRISKVKKTISQLQTTFANFSKSHQNACLYKCYRKRWQIFG